MKKDMKNIFLFCIMLIPQFISFGQSNQKIKIEILNEEITMLKNCQDAIELRVHVCPNHSMTKNLEFSQYVESDGFACAYFDLPLELEINEIPVRGLAYFLEDSNNNIVYSKGPILSGELVHPEKPSTRITVPIVRKNLKITKKRIKKQKYSEYLKSNQITIHSDTIVSIYPLINWSHRGVESGDYSLFLIYKANINDSICIGPIISNKVKLIIK